MAGSEIMGEFGSVNIWYPAKSIVPSSKSIGRRGSDKKSKDKFGHSAAHTQNNKPLPLESSDAVEKSKTNAC